LDLDILGWNDFFVRGYNQYKDLGYHPGRVASQHKNIYRLLSEYGELTAKVSGKMNYEAVSISDFPAVGDWVVFLHANESEAVIHATLPRRTKFSRQAAGNMTEEQIISANIDTVFVVTALNKDFNLNRMERYLTLVWESGANPVIILNKADLCTDIEEKLSKVENITLGTPVFAISALNKNGLDKLNDYFTPGNTIALIGSSGVGKSTIVNSIIGKELLRVNEVRDDDKGRHTTSHRELFVLPQGGMIIDTPGMRELQLWGSRDSYKETYEDIEYYAKQCHFKDCHHDSEPKCAVKKAITNGKLDPRRLESYNKIQKELAYLSGRQEYLAQKEQLFKQYRTTLRKHNKKR